MAIFDAELKTMSRKMITRKKSNSALTPLLPDCAGAKASLRAPFPFRVRLPARYEGLGFRPSPSPSLLARCDLHVSTPFQLRLRHDFVEEVVPRLTFGAIDHE